jgi:hypothetical protein
MKKLLLSLAAFSFLLVIGCQENPITDPVLTKSTDNNLSREIIYNHDFIKFDKMLVDPSVPFRNYLTITGQVEYEHRLVLLDPMPPAPQEYVNLKMRISAQLKDPNSPLDVLWNISGETEDIIYLKNDDIYILQKHYFIEGRDDGMSLLCRFTVSNDGLSLNSMWLDLNVDRDFDKASTPPDTITYPPVQILVFD